MAQIPDFPLAVSSFFSLAAASQVVSTSRPQPGRAPIIAQNDTTPRKLLPHNFAARSIVALFVSFGHHFGPNYISTGAYLSLSPVPAHNPKARNFVPAGQIRVGPRGHLVTSIPSSGASRGARLHRRSQHLLCHFEHILCRFLPVRQSSVPVTVEIFR